MDTRPHILFVDDEPLLHNLTQRLFPRHGMQVTTCGTANLAVEILKKQTFDLVITDFMMPGMDGIELLSHVREYHPDTQVIMITAHANVQHAVRTMQTGAVDYIPKPFSIDALIERVQACLDRRPASPADAGPKARTSTTPPKPSIQFIGEHLLVQQLKQLLPRIANNLAPVFIQGESGTGKEILAKLIHEMSERRAAPYVTINCANLPRELVESHLFGHRKGAFTGAIDNMTGAFERADGGTLLLDEITEIGLPIQAKLLRVLQEQEFQQVGSTETQKVNVRVIATSNRNLQEAIAEHAFREDLYHRLCVFPLSVPPLRERRSDLPLLAQYFADKYCNLYGLPAKKVTSALLTRFQHHSWPGNVRELENMMQRGVLLSAERPVVDVPDVFNEFFSDAGTTERQRKDSPLPSDLEHTIEGMEFHMIMEALQMHDHNQQLAADQLGISARTIRNKLKKYREEGWLNT